MRIFHSHRRPMWRGFLCLMAAALVLLCLPACSDQVLGPNGEIIDVGKPSGGDSTAGGLVIDDPVATEPETFEGIILPSTDDFSDAEHVLRVDFLNVGDADSILLRMDDVVILIDTGESADYSVIRTALADYGITTIDHLILTHYDNDHIGSARSILHDYTVKNVYMPEYIRSSGLYRNMVAMLEVRVSDGTTVAHRLTEDLHLDLGYGQVWINPTRLYEPGLTLGSDDSHDLQENNYSLITSITFGEIRLLFTGDAEGERIAEYIGVMGDAMPAIHVLKIPHHGGFDKELGDFLRAVKGELRYCIVSVSAEALVDASLNTALKSAGAGRYYTYNGHIRFATDGVRMNMEQSD